MKEGTIVSQFENQVFGSLTTIRNEKDEGMITIMDKRLVSKRYGKQLLDSLPPFEIVYE